MTIHPQYCNNPLCGHPAVSFLTSTHLDNYCYNNLSKVFLFCDFKFLQLPNKFFSLEFNNMVPTYFLELLYIISCILTIMLPNSLHFTQLIIH